MTPEFKTNILDPNQQKLWPRLSQLSDHWSLWDDTALALHLGHRQCPGFHFKSSQLLHLDRMIKQTPFLQEFHVESMSWDSVRFTENDHGPVVMTFISRPGMHPFHPPRRAGNGLAIASVSDLAVEKISRFGHEPVGVEDYLDVAALLRAGMPLALMIRLAKGKYGERFHEANALIHLGRVGVGIDLAPETALLLVRAANDERILAPLTVNGQGVSSPGRTSESSRAFEQAVDPHDLRDPFDLEL